MFGMGLKNNIELGVEFVCKSKICGSFKRGFTGNLCELIRFNPRGSSKTFHVKIVNNLIEIKINS